ncbi:hypothetical protein GXP70_06635 [Paenibacillus lycopersici]|uniref:Transposase DDE domain-containing protein n=1 Tax=Paenibacillus lycopersici TaxID=2704462 RepID=A0A6C0G7P9_9BACL|nr:transposase [Paenibacillus lycopersici]QHT63774.1 hypothetical protein GXP70_06635 [Paenibacillus lycopersici]
MSVPHTLFRRIHESESVFGQRKSSRGFRRFLLQGLPKGSLEVGWLSIAHNLHKMAAVDANRPKMMQR